ncbi:MAG: phosphotransferase [Rhodobacteraceae bacterium]|nr:phosphotransferase [Paracoccaceae bacterium]
MSERHDAIEAFLDSCGWGGATRTPLAGDASPRRYDRLLHPQSNASAVLMDAPPQECGSQRQFMHISAYLRSLGLSAPEVVESNLEAGLLLLEDLGDNLLVLAARDSGDRERHAYQVAVDVLAYLCQQAPPSNVPSYTAAVQADFAALALDWYCDESERSSAPSEVRLEMESLMCDALSGLTLDRFTHRDYHAENLIWLRDRQGLSRIGLLDFQDGALGCIAYDLVSLIEDARRDVDMQLRRHLIKRFAASNDLCEETLDQQIALCGLQRNLRIVGVFSRLSLAYGRKHYVDFIPRVWKHLQINLAMLDAPDLVRCVQRHIPPPDTRILARLKAGP